MPIFRKTIRSSARERMRRIDRAFERVAQILLIVNVLFIFASWASHRESFRIRDVAVLGATAVDADAVLQRATALLGSPLLYRIDRDNFLLYPKQAITSAIKGLDTRVKSVDINLVDRRKLVATVVEYSPSLLWCPPEEISATTTATSGCYFADSDGHIFARAPEYSGTPFLIYSTMYPEFDGYSLLPDLFILPPEEFSDLNVFLRHLADLGLTPRIVREIDRHDFIIVTDAPWTIRWSSSGDAEKDAENLALALEHLPEGDTGSADVESIDLRFGNKVFYR